MTKNSNEINIKTLLRRLICVPRCASCQKRLNPIARGTALDHGFPCLCDECLKKWQTAGVQMCNRCSKSASACTCMPVRNTFTQPNIPSIFFYHPDTSRAESKVIYTLKHKDSRDLFDFIVAELYPKLNDLLLELEIDASQCILTYIPRTKRAMIKNGFDQGERLCVRMAEKAGADCLPLLSREGGREQKKLSKAQRRKNADKAIYANTSMRGFPRRYREIGLEGTLKGKTVVIVEDVITTGATVQRAIKCLKSMGAGCVLVCAAARSEISADKNK